MKRSGMEEAWGNPSGGGMARAGRSGRQAKRCPNWRAEREEVKARTGAQRIRLQLGVCNRRSDTRKTRVSRVLARSVVMLEESSTA